MLKYTGHPFVDVGVATVVAFAGKQSPEQIQEVDLETIAKYMAENYTKNPLRSFLTVAFPNSGFTQPAYFEDPEKQQIYARKVLRSFGSDVPRSDHLDVFLDLPIANVSFDVKDQLIRGRAFRQHIPLLTGEDVINFFPYGEAGLPISGLSLLAIQAFPLGSAKCVGRLLAVHSDNPDIMQHYAGKFLQHNRSEVQLAQAVGSSKLTEPHLSLRTLLIDTLLDAYNMQREFREDERPFSITAYHLSNSGQQPSLDIYHLPLEVIGFLRVMMSADYRQSWGEIVQLAWEVKPKKKEKPQEGQPFMPRTNYLYEDIFKLPDNACSFLRTYFLREALHWAKIEKGDPRAAYSTRSESDLIKWKVTEQFLRRIMNMEKERINQIRMMGDRLADYVSQQNDKRFFTAFFAEGRYDYLRNILIKANLAHVKRGNPPIITFDPYIEVFEEGNELSRPDWRLARDLVLIRMVERLYEQGWLGKNPDVLPDKTETTDSNEF